MLEIPFLDWLLNISNNAVMLGANFMVQSTIILIAGLCTAYVMRHRGAAVQSLIFRAFLMAVFLCPLLSIYIYTAGFSRLTLNVPLESVKYSETASSLSPIEQNDAVTKYVPVPDKVHTRKIMVPKSNEKQIKDSKVSLFVNNMRSFFLSLYSGYTHISPLSGRAVIYITFTTLWAALSLFYLIRLSFSYLRILYIRLTAIDTDITINEENKAIAHQLKVKPPRILESSLIRSPFLTGLLKPVVILPVGLTEVKYILIHELAHLVRRDYLWNLLSHIGIALLPFQPLMKVFSNRIEDMSDYVCDDYVVNYSGTSHPYACQLVSLAEHFQPVYSEKVAGVGVISCKSGLLRRVKRILDDSGHDLITVKSGIIVYIAFLCLSITFLTGFTYFRAKSIPAGVKIDNHEKNGYASLPETNHTDTIPVISPAGQEINDNTEEPQSSSILESDLKPQINKSEIKNQDTVSLKNQKQVTPADSSQNENTWGIGLLSASIEDHKKTSPNSAMNTTLLNSLLEREEKDMEVEHYQKSSSTYADDLDIELKDITSCKKMGKELLESRKYLTAVKVFHKALEFDPNDAEANNLLGKAYFANKQYDIAETYFRIAIAIKKDYADAHFNLGDVLLIYGDAAEAAKEYAVSIKLNPSYINRKRSLFSKDRVEFISNIIHEEKQ